MLSFCVEWYRTDPTPTFPRHGDRYPATQRGGLQTPSSTASPSGRPCVSTGLLNTAPPDGLNGSVPRGRGETSADGDICCRRPPLTVLDSLEVCEGFWAHQDLLKTSSRCNNAHDTRTERWARRSRSGPPPSRSKQAFEAQRQKASTWTPHSSRFTRGL